MKKLICMILVAFLVLLFHLSFAEGLLPSLSETVGIAMPSLGEALQCYPDSETENEDGSITELYMNVSEADFNTFSVYLEAQGATLADYQVENGLLTAEIQAKGVSFQLSYDSRSGEAEVTYPSGSFDERTKNAKTHFDAVQKLLEEGQTENALTELLAIPQYGEYAPVADILQKNENFAAAAAAAREMKFEPYRTPGNIVKLGHYEQDNITANGPEEIQWIVLDYDEKEHKALLLSKYGLDVISYNTKYEDITWEECVLRNWLNGEFLQSAFSAEEQIAILKTAVDNSATQGYGEWDTNGGNNTEDQVFLLSYAEANRYLDVTYDDSDNAKARVTPTDYAIAQGAYTNSDYQTADGEVAGWWWLRSPGHLQTYAADVYYNGSLRYYYVDSDSVVVRPAFWLNLESGVF